MSASFTRAKSTARWRSRADPVLGPQPSHISDLMQQHDIGWRLIHGDVPAAIETIHTIKNTPRPELIAKGQRAQQLLADQLSSKNCCRPCAIG